MSSEPPRRRLTRSQEQDDRGSLRRHRGVLPASIRRWYASLYVLVSILSAAFPGILAYIILMFVMPPPDSAATPTRMSRPRILVTNDDGVFSEGIERLATALAGVGDVYTVAPDQERSAAGHSLTLHHPLRAKLSGPQRWSVDGTPTDCVNWGVLHLLRDHAARVALLGHQPGPEPRRRRDLLGHRLGGLRGHAHRDPVGRDLAGDRDRLHLRRGRGFRGAPGRASPRAAAAAGDAHQRQRARRYAPRRARRPAGEAPLRRGGHREDWIRAAGPTTGSARRRRRASSSRGRTWPRSPRSSSR